MDSSLSAEHSLVASENQIEVGRTTNAGFSLNSVHITSPESQLSDHFNLAKLDPELRGIILKYVQSESVVRCLELAGITTHHVLACLDELQIRRLEDFVGHACTLIDSPDIRELFLGPIFSHFPEQFRLPSGTICGLLLAAAEIKLRYSESHNLVDTVVTSTNRVGAHPFSHISTDAASQTDISISWNSTTNPLLMLSGMCGLGHIRNSSSPVPNAQSPQTVLNSTSSSVDGSRRTELCGRLPTFSSLPCVSHPDTITPSSGTVAIMAAAFQAAAAASSGKQISKMDTTIFQQPPTVNGAESNMVSMEQHSAQADLVQAFGNTLPIENGTSVQTPSRFVASVSGCTLPSTVSSVTPNFSGLAANCYEEEVVDLDRLKQHSSASATRLASRQFLNAHLIRGRDFDMEMEISTTPEGVKRVTGIFYCHLCREKRERTSAVRFSIARNRYPVLSNVLSHLKTHFQHRVQLSSTSQIYSHTNSYAKTPVSDFRDSAPPSVTFGVPSSFGSVNVSSAPYFDPHTSSFNTSVHPLGSFLPTSVGGGGSGGLDSETSNVIVKDEEVGCTAPASKDDSTTVNSPENSRNSSVARRHRIPSGHPPNDPSIVNDVESPEDGSTRGKLGFMSDQYNGNSQTENRSTVISK
ncbi:uncharacterized protein DEA37_0006541 [Paragonimus westermani]|uniref:Uncharacterized protein n=1 Tax=Paragonimus westermani TaxID=34504 RepID=A0A5J4N5I4_9TREM|nr:uncharacterized protein DEA37_0011271 [Paragonimus westermani]KAA3670782.1 uncharacterized protein DEA37_0006541 [Paragonimus westermani]